MTHSVFETLLEIEELKKILCERDGCKDFSEYSIKHGLVQLRETGWMERDMIKTFQHLRSARNDVNGNSSPRH